MADLNVKVGLDRSGFQTGLAAMENAVSGFGRNLGGILAGAFSFTAITQQFTAAISKAGQLQDLSDAFGVSAEAIQRIGNVAAESGGSLQDVGRALAKIGLSAQQAFGGNEQLAASFGAIGVSGQDLIRLSPEQLFYRLAAAMNDGSLAGRDLAVAKDLLGRGFATLMPVLKMTEEQIRAVGAAAGIMSDDAVAKLDSFGDSWGRLSNLVKVRAAEIIDASIRLGEELMANPGSLFGDWQEIEKRIDERQRKDKEAREALRTLRPEEGATAEQTAQDAQRAEREKQQAAEKTAQTYRQADQALRQNFLNSLSDADKLVELLKEESSLREKISKMAEGPDRASAVLQAVTLSGQIDRLRSGLQRQVMDGMIPESRAENAAKIPESRAENAAKIEADLRRERLARENRLRGNAADFDPREALIPDMGINQSKLEEEATQMTVRNVDERVAQYDREAAAKEASAARWKRAMEEQMDLDTTEEVTAARAETRPMIREARRRRDELSGSKAFEEVRRERPAPENQRRGDAADFDSREALIRRMQPGAQSGLTPLAMQDPVKNTTVQSISNQLSIAIARLEDIARKAGSFN